MLSVADEIIVDMLTSINMSINMRATAPFQKISEFLNIRDPPLENQAYCAKNDFLIKVSQLPIATFELVLHQI